MKNSLLIAVLLLLSSSISLYAGTKISSANPKVTHKAIDNYLVGANSDNEGVKLSCAYFMGEYKITEGVIPLMKILHDGKTEETRIIAALALTKIGTPMALYAVKEASRLDNSERVRRLCRGFYDSSLLNGVNSKLEAAL